MKNFKNFLNEIHYQDKFSQGFLDFRKKWNKKKNQAYSYYVQFTNAKGDELDRTSYEDTNHSDPAGNYGYPLKYVIDFPMDIWYGNNSRFLRVLENTAKNILYLNEIKTERDCISELSDIFTSMYISDIEEMIKRAKKAHKYRLQGNTKWAKTFFQVVQVDYTEYKDNADDYKIRSSKEQADLLLKKYDAVIDESRSINTAIINDREPNQIVFLNRGSFKVAEVFNLIDNKEINKNNITPSHRDVLGRKWSAKIFDIFDGDKIKESGGPSIYSIFYSNAGREIILDFHQPDTSYRDDIKIGQKRHKAHKLYDDYAMKLKVITEYGNISYKLYPDERFTELLNSVESDWLELKKGKKLDDFKFRSKKQKEEEEKKSRDEFYEKEQIKKDKKLKEEYPKWKERMEFWSKESGIPFKFFDDFEVMKHYIEFDIFRHTIPFHMSKDKGLEELDKMVENIKLKEDDNTRIFLLIYFGEDTDENLENAINYYEILKYVYSKQKDDKDLSGYTFYYYFYQDY